MVAILVAENVDVAVCVAVAVSKIVEITDETPSVPTTVDVAFTPSTVTGAVALGSAALQVEVASTSTDDQTNDDDEAEAEANTPSVSTADPAAVDSVPFTLQLSVLVPSSPPPATFVGAGTGTSVPVTAAAGTQTVCVAVCQTVTLVVAVMGFCLSSRTLRCSRVLLRGLPRQKTGENLAEVGSGRRVRRRRRVVRKRSEELRVEGDIMVVLVWELLYETEGRLLRCGVVFLA